MSVILSPLRRTLPAWGRYEEEWAGMQTGQTQWQRRLVTFHIDFKCVIHHDVHVLIKALASVRERMVETRTERPTIIRPSRRISMLS
jgi:hypothetical protein